MRKLPFFLGLAAPAAALLSVHLAGAAAPVANCGDPALQGVDNMEICVASGCYADDDAARHRGISCTATPLPCADELDFDNDKAAKGSVVGYDVEGGDARIRVRRWDTCEDDSLVQVSCGEGGRISTWRSECDYGCFDGRCLSKYDAPLSCDDPDGTDAFVRGIRTISGKPETDTCKDATTLQELYCGNRGTPQSKLVQCANGCKSGRCVPEGGESGSSASVGSAASVPAPASSSRSAQPRNSNRKLESRLRQLGILPSASSAPDIMEGWQPADEQAPEEPWTDEGDDEETVNAPHAWFTDVSPDDPIGKAANLLADRGVLSGFDDGTFRARAGVTRAEAAKFLLLAAGVQVEEVTGPSRFRDVPAGEWYAKYVARAAELGIIAGDPDGKFRPGDAVRRGEFLKMATMALGLPQDLPYDYTDAPAWLKPYAGVAQRYSTYQDAASTLQFGKALTRGEVAYAIVQVTGWAPLE